MKPLIRWSIANTPAMNTLMVSILIVGGLSLWLLHREVFPEFELEIIQVSVPYPGASPEEVEEGICQKIEEAVQSIDGIKKLYSVAVEGSGTVVLELQADVPDVQKVLNEVRSDVDRIPSFPELAEEPVVKQFTLRREAIQVGVVGPESDDPKSDDPKSDDPEAEVALRNLAERVRDELLLLPSVSQAEITATKEYQIDIEIPERTLRKYGLTLQDLARIVRRENIELPGGTMKTDSQEVLLRGKNKQEVGYRIAEIPLVTDPGGVVLTVGDLGTVRDEFADVTATHRVNGKPGLVIKIDKTAEEDLLAITREVRDFITNANRPGGFALPEGYELIPFGDMSVVVADRLSLLSRNGLQGLLLVFLALAVFLEIRLAFWVALGIPISVLGACGFMLYTGQTLNMLSMFAFLMALGIVVDDAIVIGENIYTHRQMGKQFIAAAVDGTVEVLPSVLASVTTTIIAFAPLMFVPGVMGKFIAVMPVVVIAMLVISLVESTFILPCHLAHQGDVEARVRRVTQAMPRPFRWTLGLLVMGAVKMVGFLLYPFIRASHWANDRSSRLLQVVIDRAYSRVLRWSLANPGTVAAAAAAILLISAGLIVGGIVPRSIFPKLDSNTIAATIQYPDGTPESVTDHATRCLERAIWQINEKYDDAGRPVVELSHRMVGAPGDISMTGGPPAVQQGSHVGNVSVELAEAGQRNVQSEQIVSEWRRLVLAGALPSAEDGVPPAERAEEGGLPEDLRLPPGYDKLSFTSTHVGPGGASIEFKLLATPAHMSDLEEAIEDCKAKLATYDGVFDVADDSQPGKWEFQMTVKDRAQSMGVPLAELAGAVRAAYYGEEVMRLQRGRHEVKLMVRYPREERRSLANFDEIRVRAGAGGAERPITELADVEVRRGYSVINRLDQLRAITVTADVDESQGNAKQIVRDLKASFMPGLLADYPHVHVRWEGQQEQETESLTGLAMGLAVALVCMFALLTLEFRSYLQPLLIMAVIPFGAIGAVLGHLLLGLPISLFSLFGMVALTGVVVNDSIVLIDFMNRRVRAGVPLIEAILDAGRRRFRPVMLTSLTTVAALLPILLERSFQAQVVIPMAVSLAFGLLFATLLVLLLVPAFYLVYSRIFTSELETPEIAPAVPPAEAPSDVGERIGTLTE